MKATLTLIALMMYLTCLHGSGTNGQQSTEMTVDALREEFDGKMAAARQETDEMRAEAAKMNTAMESQKVVIERLVERLDIQNAVIRELESDIVDFKDQIESLLADPKHDEDPLQAAFSVASHTHFGPVSEDTVMPFEIIYSNIGNYWSAAASVFMAPLDGLYQFTANVIPSGKSEDDVICHIVHSYGISQDRVASMYGRGEVNGTHISSSISQTVILELRPGDFVSVYLEAGNGYLGSYPDTVYSTFSGFLLFA